MSDDDMDPQDIHSAMLRDNQIEPHNDSDCDLSPVLTPLGLSNQSSSNTSMDLSSTG